jgi:predicted lipid carrier protein YhbT
MTTALAPIRKTVFHGSFRTGRQECWEAETTDGQWLFVRVEDIGTPWVVYRANEFRARPHVMCGTLHACRAWVTTR